jgi:hypothetical protein
MADIPTTLEDFAWSQFAYSLANWILGGVTVVAKPPPHRRLALPYAAIAASFSWRFASSNA